MSTESRLFTLATLERVLLRPLFVFLTFALVLLAIFQASGRFTMQVLPLFEDQVNALLGTQKVHARGLEGAWRGLNPVLRVQTLSFPAGTVDDLEVELDLLESMFRSSLVAAVLRASSADLHLEKNGSAWQLRGMGEAANSFDATTLVQHSDEIQGTLRLHLHDTPKPTDILQGDLVMLNHGGMHHVDATLQNLMQPDAQLQVTLWQRDARSLHQVQAHGARLSGEILLPQALTNMPNLVLKVDESSWFDEAGLGGGQLGISLDGVAIPGNSNEFTLRFSAQGEREEQHIRAVSTPLEVSTADETLVFEPFYMALMLPEDQPAALTAATELIMTPKRQPLWSMWIADMDVGGVADFFARHLQGVEAAHRWLDALALQGRARNLHVYADPELGIGYLASLTDLHMRGYHGAPTLKNIEARVWGYPRGVALQANGTDSYVGFPDLYRNGWPLDSVQGVVKAWFGDGYFAMRGSHLRAALGSTNVAGAFAITRPAPKYEQRLSLQIYADEVALLQAKTFVPQKVPAGLADWIERGPRAGQLFDAQFAMHGQVHVRPGELGRRLELLTGVSKAQVEYDPRWPMVSDIEGQVHVAGVNTHIQVNRGITGAVQLQDSKVSLLNNARYASGNVAAQGDATAMLDFVRSSPLSETLSFITPAWQGNGDLSVRGELVVPIQTDAAELSVDLDFDVADFTLFMPDYRLVAEHLDGSGAFSLPHNLTGKFSGKLFGQPARIAARYDDQWLRFDIAGAAQPKDIYTLLNTDAAVPMAGQFDLDSVLSLAMTDGVTNLELTTDLEGLSVNLPPRFAKTAEQATPSELDVQFLSDYQSVRWRYKDVNGWLHYGDGIERGALGISSSPPMTAQDERAIVIGGELTQLVLSDWVSDDGESAVALPLDWKIQNLQVDEFVIDELSFDNLKINGAQRGERVYFDVAGDDLRGRVTLPGNDPLQLDLEYLRLPDVQAGLPEHIGAPIEDPISVAVGQTLPAAIVSIDQLDIGDEAFGTWRFTIAPETARVVFNPFAADVNGLHIKESTIEWDLLEDRSSFSGRVDLDDLGETLPKWDYAPSLSTTKASVDADVTWSGSPLNVGLLNTSGQLSFRARDGRFNEVASGGGGLRILSLMNFSKVAKRISLDFSDVVGEGLSFEKIDAQIGLNNGELTFPERMLVDSSAGKFQVDGRVDLRSGALDNEMIVTLPVSKSLPWYGVYLALANPLAGIGVVVGERVLRKPIEQFSTAKFAVTGTLDDPKVDFVSLWDQSMKKPETAPTQETPAPEESPPETQLDVGKTTLETEPGLLE